MMLEVDRLYDQECMPEIFERGQGPIPWPIQTKLSSIISKFLDGDEMKSRLFSAKWLAEFYRKKGLNINAGGYHSRGGCGADTCRGGMPSPGGYQDTCVGCHRQNRLGTGCEQLLLPRRKQRRPSKVQVASPGRECWKITAGLSSYGQ